MAIVNRTLGLTATVAALGFWAGVSAWQSGSVLTNFLAGLAIVMAGNLLLGLWVWYRAPPDSGDAMVMPGMILVIASMLVGLLPRLFWPDAGRLHLVGTLASVVVPAVLLVRQIRRKRAVRRSAGPS